MNWRGQSRGSRDDRHLYFLAVKEPDDESSSCVAMINHTAWIGGWTVADVQHFWKQQGAWCAINSDAGDVLQVAYRTPDGGHELIPPRSTGPTMRVHLDANWTGAPQGPGQGSMMYFFVREVPGAVNSGPKKS